MPRRKLVDRALYVVAAARLFSWDVKQKQIAEELGISQGEVSRLLAEAVQTGWLVTKPKFDFPDQEVWRQAEQRFFSSARTRDRLRQAFPHGGRFLNRVTLIHTRPNRRIESASAQTVRMLLGKARVVGITWGPSLSRLVEAMAELPDSGPPRSGPGRIKFVPLCGEPLSEGGTPSQHSSSVLAGELSRVFNGELSAELESKLVPSIAGVQAFIPLEFRDGVELETIRRFISRVRGYGDVFGAADRPAPEGGPLADQLDAILTSVGTVERQDRGIFLSERISCRDISEDELVDISVGDVGGVIIPKPGIGKAEEDRIRAMNDRWTGMRLDHLRQCAEAAFRGGFKLEKPGVFMLALSSRRKAIVLRCVELGLVNELIIDQDLDYALAA